MENETTRRGLQERQDAPQVLPSSEESLNSTRINSASNVNSPDTASKPLSHSRCGCNARKSRGLSPKHSVFVLAIDSKPLTPTTPCRASKLMKTKQAKPIWNKFGCFGIQMLVETRREVPKTVVGIDFGTKFEGYAVAVGKENNLSVMWKLPDKKRIVKKLEERSQLRRARRQRNCRRRECRFDNRGEAGFIAPSQKVIVQSRLKAMREFFRCFPVDCVALEDVCFNHRDKKWGSNFSTMEIGKAMVKDWIKSRACLQLFSGYDTQELRGRYGYKKSGNKGAEVFNAHCSDALAIATDVYAREHIGQGKFVVVDDTYRCVRRKLHDSQFSKGGDRKSVV